MTANTQTALSAERLWLNHRGFQICTSRKPSMMCQGGRGPENASHIANDKAPERTGWALKAFTLLGPVFIFCEFSGQGANHMHANRCKINAASPG